MGDPELPAVSTTRGDSAGSGGRVEDGALGRPALGPLTFGPDETAPAPANELDRRMDR